MEPGITKIVITQTIVNGDVIREIEVNGKKKYWDKMWGGYWLDRERPQTPLDNAIDFCTQAHRVGSEFNQSQKSSNISYNASYFFSLFGKRWFNFFNFKKNIMNNQEIIIIDDQELINFELLFQRIMALPKEQNVQVRRPVSGK